MNARQILLTLVGFALLCAHTALAVEATKIGFVPISPIPMGTGGQLATSGCFGDYLNALFKLSISAGAALAAIYIGIGGFEYIFSEAMESKKDGKIRITHALMGLMILLLVTIILYIIGGPSVINLDLFSHGTCSTVWGA
jgi:hypothetical protein